jgi:hypothetical protein
VTIDVVVHARPFIGNATAMDIGDMSMAKGSCATSPGALAAHEMAVVGILLLAAGIAAFSGSRVAAAAISLMCSLLGSGILYLLLRTPSVSIREVVGTMTFIVLLLIPALVTIRHWRRH